MTIAIRNHQMDGGQGAWVEGWLLCDHAAIPWCGISPATAWG